MSEKPTVLISEEDALKASGKESAEPVVVGEEESGKEKSPTPAPEESEKSKTEEEGSTPVMTPEEIRNAVEAHKVIERTIDEHKEDSRADEKALQDAKKEAKKKRENPTGAVTKSKTVWGKTKSFFGAPWFMNSIKFVGKGLLGMFALGYEFVKDVFVEAAPKKDKK